jgi:hypothetical protein
MFHPGTSVTRANLQTRPTPVMWVPVGDGSGSSNPALDDVIDENVLDAGDNPVNQAR